MKNSIKFFGFIATVAMAVFGCAKEDRVDIPSGNAYTHTVTFSVPETRTVINEGVSYASYKWSSDDASRFYLTESGAAGDNVSITTENDYATIELSATFTHDPTPAEYTYGGFFSKNRTATPFPKIPAGQTSTASSFDPDADVLLAKATSAFNSPQAKVSLEFARVAVINKMTLKGLDEGESISSINISADKELTGYYDLSKDKWTGQSSEITISTPQTVPAGGEVTVYFVTMPVESATLSVTVTTGNYIYTKDFTRTINFVLNQVTRFGVSSFTRNDKANYSGTYVLTNEAGTKMAKAWASGDDNIKAVDVESVGDIIYYDPDALNIANAQVTATKITASGDYYGMYTLMQNGKYLYASSSSSNQLKGEAEASENAYWEISEAAGVWSIVATKSSNRNVLQNNGSVFSCYGAANQTAVKLHSISNIAPTPAITADASIALSSAAVSSATSTGATFNSNTNTVAAAAYSNAECTAAASWLSVSTTGSGASTVVKYTATANDTGAERTEYIKITATNTASRSVSKVIAVTQAAAGGANKTDILNYGWTEVSGSSYQTFEGISGSSSDAVYAGQVNAGVSYIQLNSTGSTSGIVSTTSGGKARRVTVTWNSSTTAGRTLDIYGKSTAYSAATDLYGDSKGTKLGSIVKGTSTSLEITGNYAFIGLRSNSGAMYIDEIKIEWEPISSGGEKSDVSIDFTDQGFTSGAQATEITVDGVTVTPGTGVKYYSTSPASLRVYSSNTLTFSCTTNAIKQIVFTYTQGSFSNTSFDSGSYLTNTWSGNANTVTINNDTGGQVRISSVVVKFD